jgi:hypothetical protein
MDVMQKAGLRAGLFAAAAVLTCGHSNRTSDILTQAMLEREQSLLRWLFVWSLRIAVALVVLFAIAYVCDWAVYKLRGSPQSKVTVNRFVTIPQKARKSEFDYLGTIDVPCAVAFFPQADESACWQLRRHPDVGIERPSQAR